MLNATTTAATSRITTLPELEREYLRSQLVYRLHAADGAVDQAMPYLANMMRIYRRIRWVRTEQHRYRPPLPGPMVPPPSTAFGAEHPGGGGLS